MSDTSKPGAAELSRLVDTCLKLRRENAALRKTIDAQVDYQRELRADRDRLDWLLTYEGRTWFCQKLDSGGWIKSIGSVRGFIDAAMEKESQP